MLTGGARATGPSLDQGNFIQPTGFTNVKNNMRVAQEEIFGPATCALTWQDEDEVIQLANDCQYGLAGKVWTRNIATGHRIARGLETGTVWINRYYNFKPGMPIGAIKKLVLGGSFVMTL